MTRYIDADAILKEIFYNASRTSLGETTTPYLYWKTIVALIKEAPTADVVPRAELAKIKAEVVWEMVDRLKKRLPVISPCIFDNIAREVLEEQKDV